MRWAIALALGLLSTTAFAEWETFKQERGLKTDYAVGAARLDASTGLMLVEYKRLAIQLKAQGMAVMDQFVAGCTASTRELRVLLQVRGTVMVNESNAPRVISDQSFTPPKAVPLTDKDAAELGAKVCEVMSL